MSDQANGVGEARRGGQRRHPRVLVGARPLANRSVGCLGLSLGTSGVSALGVSSAPSRRSGVVRTLARTSALEAPIWFMLVYFGSAVIWLSSARSPHDSRQKAPATDSMDQKVTLSPNREREGPTFERSLERSPLRTCDRHLCSGARDSCDGLARCMAASNNTMRFTCILVAEAFCVPLEVLPRFLA